MINFQRKKRSHQSNPNLIGHELSVNGSADSSHHDRQRSVYGVHTQRERQRLDHGRNRSEDVYRARNHRQNVNDDEVAFDESQHPRNQWVGAQTVNPMERVPIERDNVHNERIQRVSESKRKMAFI